MALVVLACLNSGCGRPTLLNLGKISLLNSGTTTPFSPFLIQVGATTEATLSLDASGNETITGVAVDASGNTHIVGYTNGSLVETNAGGADLIVAKFDRSGSVVWIRQIGTTTATALSADASTNDYGKGIAVDSSGNIFVVGDTSGSLGEANAGLTDIFIAKLNSSGTVQWISQFGADTEFLLGKDSSSVDSGNAITLDGSGNIFVGASTASNLGEMAAGGTDAVVLKFDSNGRVLWTSQIGSVTMPLFNGSVPSAANDTVNKIALDSSNNVIIAGSSSGYFMEGSAGSSDAFAAKFNSSGTLQWATQIGATSVVPLGGDGAGSDTVSGLVIDSSDDLYITGSTTGAVTETNAGGNDLYLVKFSKTGTISWGKQIGATTDGVLGLNASTFENVGGMAIDSLGNLFVAGATRGAFVETNGGGANGDVYVVKFDSSGTFQWASQVGAVTGTSLGADATLYEYVLGVSVGPSGQVVVAGYTNGSLAETNAGGTDIYVAGFQSDGSITP